MKYLFALMRYALFLSCLLVVSPVAWAAAVNVGDLTAERLVNPLGLETQHPRLSWVITSDRTGVMQTAYRILVASSPELLEREKGDVWD